MKRGTPDHPKTVALARVLDVHRVVAVGTLELLWHWTARYAPRGDVGRYPDAAIADGVLWQGQPEKLVRALVDEGWLDECPEHRLIVHDWHQHADDATKKHLSRNNLSFATVSRQRPDKSRQRPPKSRIVTPAVAVAVAGAVAKPAPEPENGSAPAPRDAPPVARATDWNREAAEDFKAVYGGTPPDQFFAQVKPVARKFGWARTRLVLREYMAETPLEFLAIPKVLAVRVERSKPPEPERLPAPDIPAVCRDAPQLVEEFAASCRARKVPMSAVADEFTRWRESKGISFEAGAAALLLRRAVDALKVRA